MWWPQDHYLMAAGIRVLYVDDELDLLAIAQYFLEKEGEFEVTSVPSALEALALPALGSFDAIISDYQMPGMDGIAFLKAVREHYGDMPFILFTGRGREEVVIEAINNGADFYLQKGGDPKSQFAELAHKLRQAVRRAAAERALRDSERRLADIIEFLPDATFAVDSAGTVIAWNRAVEEMTGVPAREMLGRGDHEYAIPFYGVRRPVLIDFVNAPEGAVPDPYTNVRRTGESIAAETDFSGPNGERIAVLARAGPLYNREGERIGAIESVRDITERRRAEEELRLLKTSVDQAFDEVFWLAFDGTILYVNEAACRTTGYSRDELLAMKIFELDPDFPPEVWNRSVEDLRERQKQHIVTRHRCRDGTLIDVEIMTSYVHRGEDEYSFAFVRDITARKRAEEDLRESEERFRDLAGLLPLVVFETDPDLRLTYVNHHAHELLGIESREVADRTNLLSFIDPSQHEAVRDALEKHLAGGPAEPVECTVRRTDGREAPVMVSASPILKDGVPYGFRGVLVDISARKRVEDGLRGDEETFRTVFEASPYPIAINRMPDYRFVLVNRAFLDASGYREEEILDKTPVELGLLPLTEAARLVSKRLTAGAIENIPLVLRAKDGSPVHVLFSTRPVTFGSRPAVVTVTAEVSALRRVEEDLLKKNEELNAAFEQLSVTGDELREKYDELRSQEGAVRASEAKFRALVELSLEGIFIADFTGTLLFANRAAGLMVDVPDYEALAGSRNIMEFVAPESHADVLRDLDTVAHGTDAYLVSYRLVTETGRTCWVECVGKKIPYGDSFAMLVSMRDVTERRDAEERLRDSEEQFAAVFRNSPVALVLVSAEDETFIDVNHAFLQAFDYSRDDVIGRTPAELEIFVDPEDYTRLVSRLRVDGSVIGMEIACQTGYGEHRICRVSSGVISTGERRGVLSTIEDVTEQKRAEEAQRESEGRFRRLAENAADMIYRMSLPDGRYEYISPASTAITGYAPEEFYADPGLAGKLVHPDWQEYFREQWEALQQLRVSPVYEFQIIDRAGRIRWVNQRNVPVADEQGTIVAIEGIVTDVTRQKTTEQELRRSEQRSLAVSTNAGSWIWEVDLDGIFRYSSPVVEQILGYRPEDLVGTMHYFDLFDPGVRDELVSVTSGAFDRREPFRHFVNLNRHRDGTPVVLSTSGTPIFDESGAFCGYCGVDEDITERTAAEAALQAMVRSMVGTTGIASLQAIVENVRAWLGADCVMIGEIQPDERTVRVLAMILDGEEIRDYSYMLAGTPCEDTAAKGFCLYPDDAARLFPESRDLVELEIRAYAGVPLRSSRGEVLGVLCALFRRAIQPAPPIQEIMEIIAVKAAAEIERTRIERALLESEERFRGMAERSSDLLFMLDEDLRPVYCSPSVRSIIGYEPDELVGRSLDVFAATVFADDWPTFLELARARGSGPPVEHVELRLRRKDGGTVYVNVHALPVLNDGVFAGMQVSMRDITVAKTAEAALRESEQRFRTLFENANDAMTVAAIGVDGKPSRFLNVNENTCRLTGYTRDELLVMSPLAIDDPETWKDAVRLSQRLMQQGDLVFERDVVRKDGTKTSVEISAHVFVMEGQQLVLSIIRDVTERRRAEAALRQANRKLTILSGITRHDIKNQLLSLDGFVTLLRRQVPDPSYERYFGRITNASGRIAKMIQFTKEYEQIGVNAPTWLEVRALAESAAADTELGRAAIVNDLPPGMEVYADPLIARVFFNLLDNALRHGGTVTAIRFSVEDRDEARVVVCEDDGTGVPAEEKETIFDRGFGQNTGFGLTISREILEITGIAIRETGEPGRGARFEIVVPHGTYRTATGPRPGG
jgi:PAS domain S-box-containing protein